MSQLALDEQTATTPSGIEVPLRVLLTGSMGSGKSFISSYLTRKHGAMRWSRTELMKRLAHAIADHIGDADDILAKLFAAEDERAQVLAELLAYMDTYAPEPGKPRRLYQDITQICQDHDPLCFERELAQRIESVGVAGFSLIDDVRSRDAFDFFAAHRYITVRVEADEKVRRQRMLDRDGYLPSEATFAHPSETELAGAAHDYCINNDGDDADELYARVDELVARMRADSAARARS